MDPTLRFQSWIRSRVSGWWATILSGVQVVDQWKFLHVWPLIFCILIVSFELEWVSNKIQPLDLPVIGRILQVGGEDKKIQTILHFYTLFYCSNSRISLIPVKNWAIIWNSVGPMQWALTRVKEYCFWLTITISYFIQRLRNTFISFANFGRSTVTVTWSAEPEQEIISWNWAGEEYTEEKTYQYFWAWG